MIRLSLAHALLDKRVLEAIDPLRLPEPARSIATLMRDYPLCAQWDGLYVLSERHHLGAEALELAAAADETTAIELAVPEIMIWWRVERAGALSVEKALELAA